jgi:hypothetical protein
MQPSSLTLIDQRCAETVIPDWVWDCCEDKTPDREFYITKGLGAGGTWGLAFWHLKRCEDNYKSKISWVVAPTYQQVIDPLLPTFTKVMTETLGWVENEDFEVIISGFPQIRLIRSGQTIFFKSANRPDRLVGSNASHVSGTEPGLWPEDAFIKSFSRARDPDAAVVQKMLEGTPEGLGNGYETRANFPEGVDEAKNRVRVIVETDDNTALKGYGKTLEQIFEHDPGKLESYRRGLFVPFTRGSAYWDFKASRIVKLNLKPDPVIPIIFSWDFGRSPLAWIAMQRRPYLTKGGILYHRFDVMACGSGKARGLDDAVAEFLVCFKPEEFNRTEIHLYGGHDGYSGSHLSPLCAFDQIKQTLDKYYQNVTIRAAKSAPLIKDSLNRINALFSYERVAIAAWCRNLIESLEQTNLKPGTWELEKPKGSDQEKWRDKSHFGDALRSPLFQLTTDEDLISLRNDNIQGFTGRL